MSTVTTVQLNKNVVKSLKEIKEHTRETYNEIIMKAIIVFKKVKSMNQYDEFLHKVQQHKMKELWNNKEDEAWESV